MKRIFVVFAYVVIVFSPSLSLSADVKADLIIAGGVVYTLDPGRPRVEAVAAAGGRIVYAGDREGARAYRVRAPGSSTPRGSRSFPGSSTPTRTSRVWGRGSPSSISWAPRPLQRSADSSSSARRARRPVIGSRAAVGTRTTGPTRNSRRGRTLRARRSTPCISGASTDTPRGSTVRRSSSAGSALIRPTPTAAASFAATMDSRPEFSWTTRSNSSRR